MTDHEPTPDAGSDLRCYECKRPIFWRTASYADPNVVAGWRHGTPAIGRSPE